MRSPGRSIILFFVTVGASFGTVTRDGPDHSLCCGRGQRTHTADAFADLSDPGYDPVLRRTRAVPTAATAAEPAGAAAQPAETTDAAVAFAPLKAPTERVEGHLKVGFDLLGGYPFKLSKEEALIAGGSEALAAETVMPQIPDVVRKLDGQKVLVSGFLLPMKMAGPLTTEFLLVANSMLCCFGVVPPMNQWIVVTLKKGVKPQQDVPVQFFGTLRVKPRIENGALSAIYQLEAERQRTSL